MATVSNRLNHRGRQIGLVLGSGAARGWAHIGVLNTLAQHGIKPTIICGCSIGALVAASHATNHLDSLEALARSLTRTRVLRYMDVSFRGGGLIEGRWIVDFFRENVEDTAIENSPIIYGAVATDLDSGRETWLTSGSIIDAVRASIAIPGLLTPIQIRGRWHVDGALVNPLPVSLCRALGADTIIGVNLNGNLMSRFDHTMVVKESEDNSTEISPIDGGVSSWLQWLRYRSADADPDSEGSKVDLDGRRPGYRDVVSQTFFLIQDFVARVRLAADPVDVLISPDVMDVGWLDFHLAERAIDAGQKATEAQLDAIRSATSQSDTSTCD